MAPRPKPKRVRSKHFFREWREKVFTRQADAEEALGWSQSKVSRLEKGISPYDQDDLEHAAEVFGCTPADLISGPPGDHAANPEAALRLALTGYGVDPDELDQVVRVITTYVPADEKSEQTSREDQPQPASRRREPTP